MDGRKPPIKDTDAMTGNSDAHAVKENSGLSRGPNENVRYMLNPSTFLFFIVHLQNNLFYYLNAYQERLTTESQKTLQSTSGDYIFFLKIENRKKRLSYLY